MPYVMNALDTQVSTQAQGKWFTFKPREIKMFYQPEIARFLGQMRGEEGLVEIEDSMMEKKLSDNPADREDFQNYIENKRVEGINARVKKLEWQKANLLSSLRYDIEAKGMKMDPLILASKGDLAALKELNKLQGEVHEKQLSIAEQVRKELGLEEYGDTSSSESGKTDQGRSDIVKPTKA